MDTVIVKIAKTVVMPQTPKAPEIVQGIENRKRQKASKRQNIGA